MFNLVTEVRNAMYADFIAKAQSLVDFKQYIHNVRDDAGKGSLYIFVDSNNKVFYINLKDQPFTCVGCRKKHEEELWACSRCCENRYCDVDCQRIHWLNIHRSKCKMAQETAISDLLLNRLIIFSSHAYGTDKHDDAIWDKQWCKPTTYRALLDSGWLRLFSCFLTQECKKFKRWNVSLQTLVERIQKVFMILVSTDDLDFQCCTPIKNMSKPRQRE